MLRRNPPANILTFVSTHIDILQKGLFSLFTSCTLRPRNFQYGWVTLFYVSKSSTERGTPIQNLIVGMLLTSPITSTGPVRTIP